MHALLLVGPAFLIVPTLCVVLIVPTLRVVTPPPDAPRPSDDAHAAWGGDAERHGMHSHAERGNDQQSRSHWMHALPLVGPALAGKLLILIFNT